MRTNPYYDLWMLTRNRRLVRSKSCRGHRDALPLRAALDEFERQYVLRTLEGTQWNVSRTARQLGVHRNTVLAKLATWGVQRPGTPEDRTAAQ